MSFILYSFITSSFTKFFNLEIYQKHKGEMEHFEDDEDTEVDHGIVIGANHDKKKDLKKECCK